MWIEITEFIVNLWRNPEAFFVVIILEPLTFPALEWPQSAQKANVLNDYFLYTFIEFNFYQLNF